jgi:hypothetical protein
LRAFAVAHGPQAALSLNPWIGDFERSSAVLVRCGRAWMCLAHA